MSKTSYTPVHASEATKLSISCNKERFSFDNLYDDVFTEIQSHIHDGQFSAVVDVNGYSSEIVNDVFSALHLLGYAVNKSDASYFIISWSKEPNV